ncbi:MAG TPA: PEP-CTERM sorting domain-containing protein [Candidatus Binatia bacterium]|nr:PEP-CTERM sorting domain-containing protein [Candidatus Binatia bacterium]
MNSKRKLLISTVSVGLVWAGISAQAGFLITNGDFSANPTQTNNVTGWFDTVTPNTGNWWETTWAGPTVSPNGTPVMGLSFYNGTVNWAYQSIGTKDVGITSCLVDFDLGSFTDAGSARNVGVTVSIYQSASFVGADNLDINGQSGVTLLGSVSLSSGSINPGQVVHEQVSLDLTGANSTDSIYLRFINYQVDSTEPWAAIDNVVLTPVPEPTTFALAGLGGMALLCLRLRNKR